MPCYTSRTSLRPAMSGGLFVATGGDRRVIPDQWLHHAELLDGSTLLRLVYSSCAVEVSGRSLDAIFDDAAAGRLGAVVAAADDDVPTSGLHVASIVFVPPADAPFAPSEGERRDE